MTQQSNLCIYPKETKIEKDTCIPLFIAALFTTARTWKQPRCLIDRCMDKEVVVHIHSGIFSSVQSVSRGRLFTTPWIAARQASTSITNSRSLLELMSIQPSHPLSSPSPPAFNLSQHQSLFQWVGSSHQVAKVLEFQLQHQFFQWTFRTDLLQNELVGSPCSPRDSQESSPTPQFKSISSLVLSFLHSPTLTSIQDHRKNHSLD